LKTKLDNLRENFLLKFFTIILFLLQISIFAKSIFLKNKNSSSFANQYSDPKEAPTDIIKMKELPIPNISDYLLDVPKIPGNRSR
jgi:hypothetical protein